MPHLPLFLNLQGVLCLVVGGGAVGQRKAKTLLTAGAIIRLVCLEAPPNPHEFDCEWIQEPYRPEHLEGVRLVFAAATPEVNAQVVQDAKRHALWVNSASNPTTGDVFLPAVGRKGKIEIAVGTSGASPLAARRICERLLKEVDDVTEQWVDFLGEIRVRLRATTLDEPARRSLLQEFCSESWREQIAQVGREGALARALSLVAARQRP